MRKSFSGILVIVLVAVLSLALLVPACSPQGGAQGETTTLRFMVTAGPGSSSYIIYAGMADLVNKYVPGVRAKLTVTSGSAESVRLLAQGKGDFATTNTKEAVDCWNAKEAYTGLVEPKKISWMYSGTIILDQLITLKPEIKTFKDLKGKKVALPPPGSSGATWIWDGWVRAHGMSHSDFSERPMLYADHSGALADGSVDAAFLTTTTPTASIAELAIRHKVYFVEPDPQSREKLVNEVLKGYYVLGTLKSGLYPFLDHDVPTAGVGLLVVARSDLDENIVYQLTKTLGGSDHRAALIAVHKGAEDWIGLSKERTLLCRVIPDHPGATRYWKEVGFIQ